MLPIFTKGNNSEKHFNIHLNDGAKKETKNNWKTYKGSVNNDIRISISKQGNFHLHEAVHLPDEKMKKLESTIEIDFYPSHDFTVFTKEYKEDGQRFLDTQYQEWQQKNN